LSKGSHLVEDDIADPDKLRSCLKRVDAVMHFAASAYVGESVVNPDNTSIARMETTVRHSVNHSRNIALGRRASGFSGASLEPAEDGI
jgi:UDP-glucose 4-epimerase